MLLYLAGKEYNAAWDPSGLPPLGMYPTAASAQHNMQNEKKYMQKENGKSIYLKINLDRKLYVNTALLSVKCILTRYAV